MHEFKLTCATVIVFVGLALFISNLAKGIGDTIPNRIHLQMEFNLEVE